MTTTEIQQLQRNVDAAHRVLQRAYARNDYRYVGEAQAILNRAKLALRKAS